MTGKGHETIFLGVRNVPGLDLGSLSCTQDICMSLYAIPHLKLSKCPAKVYHSNGTERIQTATVPQPT